MFLRRLFFSHPWFCDKDVWRERESKFKRQDTRYGRPDLATLTKDAMSFYHQTLLPIHCCLDKHFGNDKALFLKEYPKMRYSHFSKKCTALLIAFQKSNFKKVISQ
jgi:hypothetical protein